MHKIAKNILQKSFKSAKMTTFENSLNPSKHVQIEFWIVEKIAIEYLNRMLKKWWKFIQPIFWYCKYCCQGALFACFWKSEKMNFCWYLLKERSYDLIDVWKKKLMILPDFHLKYFFIWIKIDENIHISNRFIF